MAVAGGVRRRRDKVRTLVTLGKKFLAFLFSHIGLCALMIAYTMLGSVLFRAIEGPHERDTHQYVRTQRNLAVDSMWWSTSIYNAKLDIWTSNISSELNQFKSVLLHIIEKGYDANDQSDNTQWTFAGAFLYSLTVITTIGYGNIACRTSFGKAMTIVYAILGIPLMLLFLTNIGDVLARVFKFLYRKTVRLRMQLQIWNTRRKALKIRRASGIVTVKSSLQRLTRLDSRRLLMSSPLLSSHQEEENEGRYVRSPKRSFLKRRSSVQVRHVNTATQTSSHNLRRSSSQRMSTSSAGSYKGGPPKPRPSPSTARQWVALTESGSGHSTAALLPLLSVGGASAASITVDDLSMEQIRGEARAQRYELEELSLRESMEEKLANVTVPLWLVFSTMFAYLIAGATMFTLWERWSFFSSFYFCYISLATIGFGDLFPAASLRDSALAQEKLTITSLYLLFGMALIAMCFNLAQEEVVSKMASIAEKLGITRSSSHTGDSVCETE